MSYLCRICYIEFVSTLLLLCIIFVVYNPFLFFLITSIIFSNISQVFNVWGTQITASLSVQYYTSLLKNNALVSVEDAIFRNEKTFIPGNLNRHRDFWEKVILKDHTHK